MAYKKQSATTVRSASATARRSPLSPTAIRLFGAVLAFIGIILCKYHSSFINYLNFFIDIFAIALTLGGAFLIVSNLRKILGKYATTNDVLIYFLIGILMLVGGILILVFNVKIRKWLLIMLGCLVVLYGLCMIIKAATAPRSKNKLVYDVIVGVLTVIAGILIAILYVNKISSASNGICYYIFGAIAAAVGTLELLTY